MILNMYLNECSDSTMLIESLEVNGALNNINNILLSEASDVSHVRDIKTKFLKLIEKMQKALKELWTKIKKMIQSLFSKLKKKKVDDSQITFEFRSKYLITDPIRVFKNALNLLHDMNKYISYTDPEDIIKVKYQLEELNGKGVYERLECSKDAQVYNINVRDISFDNTLAVTDEYSKLVDAIDVACNRAKGIIKNINEDIKFIAVHCKLILNIINKINSVCASTVQDYARMAQIASSKM